MPGDARGIRDALTAKFGRTNVFMDVGNLLAGQRFDRELEKALAQCDVLIAVMGPRWMDLLTARTQSDERDYVREEIAAALTKGIRRHSSSGGREGAMPPLPRAQALPDDIRDLILHQKHDVAHGPFRRDISDLITSIETIKKGTGRPPLAMAIRCSGYRRGDRCRVYCNARTEARRTTATTQAEEEKRQQAVDAAVAKLKEDRVN